MPYLVDTDVLVDVSRKNEAAIDFLDHLDDPWSISIITALELIVALATRRKLPKSISS
jgi:predicted nucleic acid-binding protein